MLLQNVSSQLARSALIDVHSQRRLERFSGKRYLMVSHNQEVIDLLIEAYCLEIETVTNFIANSINMDGIRAEEIKKALAADVMEEILQQQTKI